MKFTRYSISFTLFFVIGMSNSDAQDFKTGLTPPTRESLQKMRNLNYASHKALPIRFDLKKKMPPIGDQGNQGSCAAWASGYAFASYYFGVEKNWPLTKGLTYDEDHVMSPTFVYGHRLNFSRSGMGLDEAFEIMSNYGNVPMSILPYDDKRDPHLLSNSFQLAARSFKISEFRVLYGWKGLKNQVGRLDIREPELAQQLKGAIYDGTPVVAGLCVNSKFQFLGKNLKRDLKKDAAIKYSEFFGANEIPIVWNERNIDVCGEMEKFRNQLLPEDDPAKIGGHAVIFIGWDDTMGSDGAFLIQNSWGEEWGDHGLGWLDYQSLKEVMMIAVSSAKVPQPGAEPKVRPDFIDVPGVNESLWTAGVKKIKNGMRMKEVFDLIGGPNNFEDIRFVMGGVSVFPEDTNEAEGVSPWIYQSDKLELLINIEWKDGRVSAVPIRAFKKTVPADPKKLDEHHAEIKKGMTYEEVASIIGGCDGTIQFLENGKLANGAITFKGPDYQYEIVIDFEDGKVVRKKQWFKAKVPDESEDLVSQNYDKVTKDMKPAEVHRLLGGPFGSSGIHALLSPLYFYGVDEKQRPRDGHWLYTGKGLTMVAVEWEFGVVKSVRAYKTDDSDAPPIDKNSAKSNYKRLKRGMNKLDVYRLLGGTDDFSIDPKSNQPLDFLRYGTGNTGWHYHLSDTKDILELRWKDGRLDDWEVFKK